jgi:hypothetical protein
MLSGRCLAGFSLGLLLIAGCEDGGDAALDANSAQDGGAWPEAGNGMDAGANDAAPGDAGADAVVGADGCVPFVMPDNCTIPENSALYSDLRCTGLYGRFEQRELACNVEGYVPAYPLWSDGADKHRYVWLPPGGKLDASDPDEIVYPVGTKFWKEFRLPNGGRLLETRLLQRVETGWLYTTYVWSEDQTTATQNNDGVPNLLGTGHVVPNRDQCDECHRGRKDKILGWDALLLGAGAQGITRDQLVQRGLFMPGKELPSLNIPGDEIDSAALGYMHANCGVSCHNSSPRAKGGNSGLNLRLDAAKLGSVLETPAVTTSVNHVPSTNEKHTGVELPPDTEPRGYMYDIRPGDPARSFIVARMKTRGGDGAMPQIATNVVDQAGVAAVTAWIERMASPPYPAAGPVPYDPEAAP